MAEAFTPKLRFPTVKVFSAVAMLDSLVASLACTPDQRPQILEDSKVSTHERLLGHMLRHPGVIFRDPLFTSIARKPVQQGRQPESSSQFQIAATPTPVLCSLLRSAGPVLQAVGCWLHRTERSHNPLAAVRVRDSPSHPLSLPVPKGVSSPSQGAAT